MAVKIKLDSTNKILAKRKIQKGGEAQIFFTKQCAKWMNNYTPFKTGRLKDMSVTMGVDYVKYNTPYARKQYYTNNGNGIKNRSGLRGKRWDIRMWNDKRGTIVKSVADFVGGKAE
ncbi:capsid protein [Clostridium botulinum]|uniref:minor capsid protein n=1 Tax=Clostridium botulinum TaxID=1491 RepID=UPI000772FA12|nr:minor capsid protein [Clostridium botulinum]NFH81725.1 capsid protein [Clostridium botulinum]NFH84964.1 capsid protein [Clostridium botulinum]NFI12964.1 capsid protein [Clostridium botulinum]NFI16162.1 capsid protein [Clostridium botulinum]NFO85965.1 capsid protein [Clostridium botulinum]